MKIYISKSIGTDLRTRSFFRRDFVKLVEHAKGEVVADFTNVVFISRSVADEIYNLLCDYPNVKIQGLSGDAEMMYSIVVKGRNNPRVYPNSRIKVIHLETLEDMDKFFSSF